MKKDKSFVVCTDINGRKFKAPIGKLTFRPSVYGIIIEKNKVLLSKQWDGYDYPGGGVAVGEPMLEALKREVFEEVGLKVKVGPIVHLEDAFFKHFRGRGKFIHSILMYFICYRVGGRLSIKNIGPKEKSYIGSPEWIDIKDISKVRFYNPIDNVKLIKEAVKILT